LQKERLKKEQEDLRKIQEALLNEDSNAESQRQASAAQKSLIGEYTSKIKAKIRGNVNKTLCGDGNPELRFKISLLPTGEYSSSPVLTKSSGITACDEAVERAILISEPLPLPTDEAAKAAFRNLNLRFKPNDN
jgi:colicin import membrane protein